MFFAGRPLLLGVEEEGLTKWGRVGLASFADLGDVDCVITDSHAPADLVKQVRALGIEVILV